MKIFDKFGNEHPTVEAALAAEKAQDEKVAEERARKEKLISERAARAKEVENAFKNLAECNKEYKDLLNDFVKDYGSYHYTISENDTNNMNDWDVIEGLFNTFFNF